MPQSISAAQNTNFTIGGESRDNFIEFKNSKNMYQQLGIDIVQTIGKYANQRGVSASGNLLSKTRFDVSEDGSVLRIYMPDYYDYPNKGVKGVKSSSNAPNSPYQYKNYGMSTEGRRSLKKYIRDGHAKIANVRKDKALGIGQERKGVNLLDVQVNTLSYLIKRFGIKATHYFDDALKEVFKGVGEKMKEALSKDIVLEITTDFKKK